MKIVADPNIPSIHEAFAPLGDITLVPGRQLTAPTSAMPTCLLVRSVTPVNAALLDGSRIRFVATATIGFDHVDVAYLAAHGIGFATAAGSNANSVAEYIIAALLELATGKIFGSAIKPSASSVSATLAPKWFVTPVPSAFASCSTTHPGNEPKTYQTLLISIISLPSRHHHLPRPAHQNRPRRHRASSSTHTGSRAGRSSSIPRAVPSSNTRLCSPQTHRPRT